MMPGPWSLGVRVGAAARVSEVSITFCSRFSLLLCVRGLGVDVRLGPSLSVVELVHTVYRGWGWGWMQDWAPLCLLWS